MSQGNGVRVVEPASATESGNVLLTETEFVTRWYQAAIRKQEVASEIAAFVPPEALTNPFFAEAYELLTGLHAKAESVEDMVVTNQLRNIASKLGEECRPYYEHLTNMSAFEPGEPDDLRSFARRVIGLHRGRCQVEMLAGAASMTSDAMSGLTSYNARQVADDLIDRLTKLHSRFGEVRMPITHEEIVDYLLAKVDPNRPPGIDWPWPRLQRVLGTIPPGRVIGLTAYSGNGKTMLADNLFLFWVLAGVPVIVIATEMELAFLERAGAAYARIPKEYAEEGDWRTASQSEMKRYRNAMRSLIGHPWDILQQSSITPAEVMNKVRSLRRKFRGQHVIVIVDHMHRLKYPNGVKADDALGASLATQEFKNMAASDREGGLSFLCLYQPKKPEEPAKQFSPVLMSSMRGHGGSANEVDVHMTIWRRSVKTTPDQSTPWGTSRAVFAKPTDLMPATAEFGSVGSKLDDEHVYIMHDKHRIRGASSDLVLLNIHSPSGFIYQDDWLAGTDREG